MLRPKDPKRVPVCHLFGGKMLVENETHWQRVIPQQLALITTGNVNLVTRYMQNVLMLIYLSLSLFFSFSFPPLSRRIAIHSRQQLQRSTTATLRQRQRKHKAQQRMQDHNKARKTQAAAQRIALSMNREMRQQLQQRHQQQQLQQRQQGQGMRKPARWQCRSVNLFPVPPESVESC